MPETTAAVDRATVDIPTTRSARDVLERAVEAASRRNTAEATPVDVLRAVLANPGALASEAMRALGIDPAQVAAKIPQDGEVAALSLRQLVVNANREAQVLGHYQVDSIHLLLALLYHDARPTAAILQSAGLTLYDLRRHMQTGGRAGTPLTPGAKAPTRAPDGALRRRPWPSLRPVLGVSRVFLGLVAGMLVSGVLLWLDFVPGLGGPLTLVFVLLAWVVSVCVHEFFHAVVAYLGGDRDVAVSGYLTLNPLRYTSVVMSIVFPVVALLLGGIGFPGGAVYINHAMLRSRTWDSLVSLAGPVANVLFALACAAIVYAAPYVVAAGASLTFVEAIAFLGFLEVFAVVLNLVPIPPLDGFGILRPWLPWSVQSAAVRIGTAGYLIVFLLMFYVPPVGGAVVDTVSRLTSLIGIDPFLVALGSQNMRLR